MVTAFKIKQHLNPLGDRRGVDIVEVWIDDVFVATIYPMDRFPGLRIISKYMEDIHIHEGHPRECIIPLTARLI